MNSINWDAIAAIGQCTGALATFLAVLVALKSSKDASTVKVKVNVWMGFFVFKNGHLGADSIFCGAVNTGLIPIKLTNAGIRLPNKKQLIFDEFKEAIPKELKSSDATQYSIEINRLIEVLKSNGIQGNVTLKFYFGDTRGNRYYKKWKFNTNKWS